MDIQDTYLEDLYDKYLADREDETETEVYQQQLSRTSLQQYYGVPRQL